MKLINKILVFFKVKPTPVVPQMTKEEIIQETVDYYSADPARRGISQSGCAYNTETGGHCAVGRCLSPKYHKQGIKLNGNTGTVETLIYYQNVKTLDDLLQDKYRGHEISFWRMLQRLHDFPNHWDFAENNVTEDGIFHIKEMETAFDFKLTLPK